MAKTSFQWSLNSIHVDGPLNFSWLSPSLCLFPVCSIEMDTNASIEAFGHQFDDKYDDICHLCPRERPVHTHCCVMNEHDHRNCSSSTTAERKREREKNAE